MRPTACGRAVPRIILFVILALFMTPVRVPGYEAGPFVQTDGSIPLADRIRAELRRAPAGSRAGIRISSAVLARPNEQAAADPAIFTHGEEIQIRIQAGEPAFLHLFRVDEAGALKTIFPNSFMRVKPYPPGKEFRYPPDVLRKKRLRLRASCPEGMARQSQAILAVVSRSKLDLSRKPRSLADLARILSSTDPSGWEAEVFKLEVVRP